MTESEKVRILREALEELVELVDGHVYDGDVLDGCTGQPGRAALATERAAHLATHATLEASRLLLEAETTAHHATAENQQRQWAEKDIYRTRAIEAETRLATTLGRVERLTAALTNRVASCGDHGCTARTWRDPGEAPCAKCVVDIATLKETKP